MELMAVHAFRCSKRGLNITVKMVCQQYDADIYQQLYQEIHEGDIYLDGQLLGRGFKRLGEGHSTFLDRTRRVLDRFFDRVLGLRFRKKVGLQSRQGIVLINASIGHFCPAQKRAKIFDQERHHGGGSTDDQWERYRPPACSPKAHGMSHMTFLATPALVPPCAIHVYNTARFSYFDHICTGWKTRKRLKLWPGS